MTYKLVGQEPYQIPSNADLGTLAYQNADGINVGLVNIGNTASIAGLVAPLTIGYSQSAASTLLYLTQVPTNLSTGGLISGSNIAANTTVTSFVAGFATYQPTYTATTASTLIALTSTYGLSVSYGVGGTGITYGTVVSSISNAGVPITYGATSATSGLNVVYIGTTTNVAVNQIVLGTGITTGTYVTSILASTYATLNQPATVSLNASITFVPTVTLSSAIVANTLTQNLLFFPTVTLNQNSSAAVVQGTVVNNYVFATGAGNAALVIQQGGIGVTGNSYFANAVNITGNLTVANITATAITSNLIGVATTATNVAGGAAGSIPIQVSPGVTAFVPLGTSGYVLTAGANTATWSAVSGLSAGTATNANNVLTTQQVAAGSYYPVFVSANNATGAYMPEYTTSTFQVNPGSGLVTVGSLSVGTAGATFNGPVTFNGTASFILSTNTYYTDNMLELHIPPTGVTGQWTSDDGKDVGFRFHYYNRSLSTDSNAALVLANDTQYLEFYNTGAEVSTGTFTTATYGTFKTGNIILAGTTASVSTTTGALIITGGGAGIGGTLWATQLRQTSNIVTIGAAAGAGTAQGASAIAIGSLAGNSVQASGAMAIGAAAGNSNQGINAIALGGSAGNTNQGTNAIALGTFAGNDTQGAYSIAIGYFAGQTSQPAGSIIISATSTNSISTVTNRGLYITPIRADASSSATTYSVYYNPVTREVTTSTAATGGSSTGTTSTFLIANTTSATSTTTGALQVYGGAGIGGDVYVGGAIYTGGNKILPTSIQEFTATAGQTTFTVAGGYVVGQILVYANGILLSSTDYTASNGSTVVVNDARRASDVIRVVVGQNNSVSLQQAYTFNQYTSNGTTTTFATSYNTATVQVFQNGVLQMPTTYTANNGTSVIFGSIPTNGTSIGVISFNSISIANAISSSGGTINGTLNVVGTLQVNGNNMQNYATAMSVVMGI